MHLRERRGLDVLCKPRLIGTSTTAKEGQMLAIANDKQLAYAQVSQNAIAVATEALRTAQQAGAFDTVATALLFSIAAIVRRERGDDRLADWFTAALLAADKDEDEDEVCFEHQGGSRHGSEMS
jgi:hypothetical protein